MSITNHGETGRVLFYVFFLPIVQFFSRSAVGCVQVSDTASHTVRSIVFSFISLLRMGVSGVLFLCVFLCDYFRDIE